MCNHNFARKKWQGLAFRTRLNPDQHQMNGDTNIRKLLPKADTDGFLAPGHGLGHIRHGHVLPQLVELPVLPVVELRVQMSSLFQNKDVRTPSTTLRKVQMYGRPESNPDIFVRSSVISVNSIRLQMEPTMAKFRPLSYASPSLELC